MTSDSEIQQYPQNTALPLKSVTLDLQLKWQQEATPSLRYSFTLGVILNWKKPLKK